jgi:hypothetical protein
MFPALNQNLGGQRFKVDVEEETVGAMKADDIEQGLR